MKKYDYLIVGAGLFGAVFAERAKKAGKTCLVIDKREQIAGNVYSKEECKSCFAKFYCSGGCAANAYNFSGDINGAYDIGCELQRKRTEVAIMMNAAVSEAESV